MTRLFRFLFTFLLFSAGVSGAHAQSVKTIILKDGSKLRGQVVSLENGVYKIENSNLGNVEIREENVVSISAGDFSGPAPTSLPVASQQNFKSQIQSIQGNVMNDPALMQDISELTQDPEMMKILNDKSLVNDIYSYDPNRIQNNPKIQQLMQNPKMLELINKVQQRQGQ